MTVREVIRVNCVVPTLRVHGDRPVNKVQVDVGSLEQVQALLEALLGTGVECAPELAGNEQVLTLHDAALDNVLKSLTDLILVLVAESAVNVPVTALNGVDDSLLDLTRRRLPRSQTEGGDRGASVEGDCSVHVGLGMKNRVRGGFEDELGKGGIHGGTGYMYITRWSVVWGSIARLFGPPTRIPPWGSRRQL